MYVVVVVLCCRRVVLSCVVRVVVVMVVSVVVIVDSKKISVKTNNLRLPLGFLSQKHAITVMRGRSQYIAQTVDDRTV